VGEDFGDLGDLNAGSKGSGGRLSDRMRERGGGLGVDSGD